MTSSHSEGTGNTQALEIVNDDRIWHVRHTAVTTLRPHVYVRPCGPGFVSDALSWQRAFYCMMLCPGRVLCTACFCSTWIVGKKRKEKKSMD